MLYRSYVAPTRFSKDLAADPFSFMQRALRNGIEDTLTNLTSATEAAAMPVRLDVREDDKAFHVSADLPGLNEKEVDITFDDGVLTIRGEKKVAREEGKDTWHVIERAQGSFARQISLAANLDVEKIEAKFEKGVLTVSLPKLPEEQTSAKKIAIKTVQ